MRRIYRWIYWQVQAVLFRRDMRRVIRAARRADQDLGRVNLTAERRAYLNDALDRQRQDQYRERDR